MKIAGKILIIALLFGALELQAQLHTIGVKGGYGGGSVRFDPAKESGMLFGLPSGGVSWRYYSPVKYIGGIGADLQYIQKGYQTFPRINSDTSYQRKINAIEVPFLWQPHVYLFKQSTRVFLNLGVYLSYNLSSSEETVSKKNGVLSSGEYRLRLVRDNIWDYGLCGGFGIAVIVKRIEILAEARYNYGYADLLKNGTKYPGNPMRSPIDALNISLGVNYRLGKNK